MKLIIKLLPVLILFSCTSNSTNDTLNDSQELKGSSVENSNDLLHENINSVLSTDSGFTQAVSIIDLNNDGYPEIFATNTGIYEKNLFYQNNKGVFTKDSVINVTLDKYRTNGCSWADFDNNNTVDLVVANRDDSLNILYINNNLYQFSRNKLNGNNKNENWSYGVSWCDADNDGYLDLFITNSHNQKNKFYHNINGELKEKSIPIITNSTFTSIHAVWTDLNNDQLQDLIICEDGENHLYINNGGLDFTLLENNIVSKSKYLTYGCSAGDYNNDGLIDLFFANWAGTNELFMNIGELNFKKIKSGEIVKDYEHTEGSCWGDYDNDGFIDLIVTNDGVNRLYKNIEGKSFKSIPIHGLTDTIRNSNGTVWLDANNNGFLDLFIANGKNEFNQFFNNIGNKNNYVKIQLTGTSSNRSAIGSKIKLFSNGNMQTQEISSQSGGGCGSQKSLTLHFGTGNSSKIDSLIIQWPSGITKKIYNLEVNKKYKLTE
jgi:hypothetical protein